MFAIIAVLTGAMLRVFRSRRNLLLEDLVLRQQLAVVARQNSICARDGVLARDTDFAEFQDGKAGYLNPAFPPDEETDGVFA